MKTKNLFYAFLFGALSLTACSDDDEVVEVNQNVPSNVLKSFNSLYKGVNDVKWDKVNEYHVARFNGHSLARASEGYTTSAWFTEEGKHCQADQDIDFKDLPQVVKDAFNAYKEKMKYADWKVDDCEVVRREGMSLIYVIEIELGKMEREISISEAGDILKDVVDDDDLNEILPVLISEELKAALKNLFPKTYESITYLELEIEDDEIEVDIMESGRHKEVEFDAKYNWKSTEYKVTLAEAMKLLKPEVLDKLIKMAKLVGIDLLDPSMEKFIEIEVKEDVKDGLSMEIEIEIGGKEFEVEIDSDGNIKLDD